VAPGRATYRSPGWTDREFREIPVTWTEPDAPGTATPIAAPMAANGTAATAVGRKPWVELWPDGAEASGSVSSDKWISVVVLVDRALN
jgi:hypothetical protein